MSEVTEVEVSFTAQVKVMAVGRAIETQRPDAFCFDPFAEACHSAAKKWQLLPISVQ
jgi:O-methyltransferase involved in polyketide biosynthesis